MPSLFENWLNELATPERLLAIAASDFERNVESYYKELIEITSSGEITPVFLASLQSCNVLSLSRYYHTHKNASNAILACGIFLKSYSLGVNQKNIDDEPITIIQCYFAIRDFAPNRLKDYCKYLEEVEKTYTKPNDALPFYDMVRSMSYFISGLLDNGAEALNSALQNMQACIADNTVNDYKFNREPLFQHIVAGDRYTAICVQELERVVPETNKGTIYDELIKCLT